MFYSTALILSLATLSLATPSTANTKAGKAAIQAGKKIQKLIKPATAPIKPVPVKPLKNHVNTIVSDHEYGNGYVYIAHGGRTHPVLTVSYDPVRSTSNNKSNHFISNSFFFSHFVSQAMDTGVATKSISFYLEETGGSYSGFHTSSLGNYNVPIIAPPPDLVGSTPFKLDLIFFCGKFRKFYFLHTTSKIQQFPDSI